MAKNDQEKGGATIPADTKENMEALKTELTAKVDPMPKDIRLSQQECCCYGCEGCGYNCGPSPGDPYFYHLYTFIPPYPFT